MKMELSNQIPDITVGRAANAYGTLLRLVAAA